MRHLSLTEVPCKFWSLHFLGSLRGSLAERTAKIVHFG